MDAFEGGAQGGVLDVFEACLLRAEEVHVLVQQLEGVGEFVAVLFLDLVEEVGQVFDHKLVDLVVELLLQERGRCLDGADHVKRVEN